MTEKQSHATEEKPVLTGIFPHSAATANGKEFVEEDGFVTVHVSPPLGGRTNPPTLTKG